MSSIGNSLLVYFPSPQKTKLIRQKSSRNLKSHYCKICTREYQVPVLFSMCKTINQTLSKKQIILFLLGLRIRVCKGQGKDKRQAVSAYGLTLQYATKDIREHSYALRVAEGCNPLPNQVKRKACKDAFKC
jgi:hypothetical protein